TATLAHWREDLESVLPNLLTDNDINRMERMLARLVRLVPREYHNGVADGNVLIPLEHREATQFAEQAQALSNELAPVWRTRESAAYTRWHANLAGLFEQLRRQVADFAPNEEVEYTAGEIDRVLGNEFGLNARLEGDKGKVIEETALEVRANL